LLRPSQEVHSMQMEVMLILIQHGYDKPDPIRYYSECFSCIPKLIKAERFDWIPLLLPYPDQRIASYIELLNDCLAMMDAGKILNGFKITKAGRKFFQQYFGNNEHWLLSYILKNSPECISKLVQGNETELLQPFLKIYKKEISLIKDSKGNNLLHSAALSGSPSETMVLRLIELGCSVNQKNDKGESPISIALKRKNKDLVAILERKF